MSDTEEETLNEILSAVEQIRDAQKFQVGNAIATALAASVSFIIALALNDAFKKTFELIPVGKGLLGIWIYAVLALVIGISLLYVISRYVQPSLFQLFEPKKTTEEKA